mmetsp:Transcript_14862/g.24590  ORF Transcript_14862/g.24590 Transcript_14862/m.24590 type:complete len:332 (+) Transcript_14862:142-1137(+)|eukprot:CAMPEP_0114450574 /NCGR_PEP_ID=MMETSP0104-20121206/531_1 /TAXON_ID=37642 ORGANISM="Paraphysomonas imperforata, Strain PA2" /NCGR_SAMPLE_ID=MMETSP0104 /ASSEMBLY_ACC=CAM_ASM_000202 /LENGTH=331 /DNA_ID=CAMNT_0001622721 /DNA_START=95 /DNA_END=1090 /DNA_ORIENTATION=+
MNVIREIERINAKELENGIYGGCSKGGSWHDKYKNSAWVYVGGLPYELTEGDIICVMSQWGEIEDINLVREKGTNKSQGFAFVKYEDQRSTILAVDNFNGIQILQRIIRVDHVDQYKLPKEVREREEQLLDEDPEASVTIGPGHAYKSQELDNEYSISSGVDHWQKPSTKTASTVVQAAVETNSDKHSRKKKHKDHKEKSKKKHKRERHSDEDVEKHHKHHKKKRSSSDRDEDAGRYHHHHHDRQRLDSSVGQVADTFRDVPPAAPSSSSAPKMSSTALPSENALSWRGNRDPAVKRQADDARRRQRLAEQRGPVARRDEFSGFGGMNRRR